jgi:hypothetical protein
VFGWSSIVPARAAIAASSAADGFPAANLDAFALAPSGDEHAHLRTTWPPSAWKARSRSASVRIDSIDTSPSPEMPSTASICEGAPAAAVGAATLGAAELPPDSLVEVMLRPRAMEVVRCAYFRFDNKSKQLVEWLPC